MRQERSIRLLPGLESVFLIAAYPMCLLPPFTSQEPAKKESNQGLAKNHSHLSFLVPKVSAHNASSGPVVQQIFLLLFATPAWFQPVQRCPAGYSNTEQSAFTLCCMQSKPNQLPTCGSLVMLSPDNVPDPRSPIPRPSILAPTHLNDATRETGGWWVGCWVRKERRKERRKRRS